MDLIKKGNPLALETENVQDYIHTLLVNMLHVSKVCPSVPFQYVSSSSDRMPHGLAWMAQGQF